jgi:hypothetical protein
MLLTVVVREGFQSVLNDNSQNDRGDVSSRERSRQRVARRLILCVGVFLIVLVRFFSRAVANDFSL